MKTLCLSILFAKILVMSATGQDKNKERQNNYDQLVQRYENMRDSLLKLNLLLPGVSSVMMNKNQLEINLYNTLLSANKARNNNGEIFDLNTRSTYLRNTLQLTYGISKNFKWNAGLEVNFTTARIDNDTQSSMFKVFNSTVAGNSKFARAVTSIAPGIRWKPFQKNYNFTIHGSLLIPTINNTEKESLLGTKQFYFQSQFIYNFQADEHIFLISQMGFQYGFQYNDVSTKLFPNLGGHVAYYIPHKTILFALVNYAPFFMHEDSWKYTSDALQIGGGVLFQICKNMMINGYYTNYVRGKNNLCFKIYSIGLRFITN
jgi:hypothetical protein